ncbi:hypothetical protein LRP31_34995 (plasmid) [Mesorhizobium mediterraneum]|uniref:Uncharacterized protein n=1 Tax=Mesorhizobium mediterraneum TaxID=43617 RepID=A0AB36RG33_9HYPH|nr:hypothetical protein [Mesorhizobium mediterraneum]PAQ03765.1 hypothetical protein CIT25_02910 [Mesorhizobium mediterraneum]WIW57338.1 hypothetical protein LRP31_34995 [Mesorhizobium mediterraneum]
MNNWFTRKPAPVKKTPLDHFLDFLDEYEESGNDKQIYAMSIWGLFDSFGKIFGTLKMYQVADDAKKKKYITTMANRAIELLESEEKNSDIISACYRSIVNYLTAIEGKDLSSMEGRLQQASAELFDMVAYGGKRMTEIGQMEQAASDFLSNRKVEDGFRIGGISLDKHPDSPMELLELAQKLAPVIAQRVRYDQDFYWFLIEQYDRLHGQSEYFDGLLSQVGLQEIEYAGMRSEDSYVKKPNPGVTFFQKEIVPPLSTVVDKEGVVYASIVIFVSFCEIYKKNVTEVRRKYATHYHNNCVSQSSFDSADRWVKVLDSI